MGMIGNFILVRTLTFFWPCAGVPARRTLHPAFTKLTKLAQIREQVKVKVKVKVKVN